MGDIDNFFIAFLENLTFNYHYFPSIRPGQEKKILLKTY